MSLFTKGIYLTDSPRVAGDYAENANTGKFSFGKFKTRAEVIERHIRTLARLTSDEGKVGDSFGYNNNDATFPARLKQAAAWWKEHSKEFSVRQATDKTWTIQRKEKKTSAKHIYDVPEDVLARTLDAESEVPSKVLSELTYTLRSLGDGATARDIDTFVDQYVRGPEASGYRPSFREIYTGITADSPLISEDGQKAFRQALKKLGYTGIQYSGGITMGGGPKHTAYVLWDEQALKDWKVTKKSGREHILKFNPNHDKLGRFATSAFKTWFEGSEVVNPDGSPKRVFHSTNADFDEFQIQGLGAHFGTSAAANDRADMLREFSENVVHRDPGTFSVMPVYLSLKNPLRMRDQAEVMEEIEDGEGDPVLYARNWEAAESVALTLLEDGVITMDEFDSGDDTSAQHSLENIRKILQSKGYDGIVYRNAIEDAGNDSYIVFSPEQIKSATGNSGEFSLIDRRITKFNQNHEPAGTPQGGQFARKPGVVYAAPSTGSGTGAAADNGRSGQSNGGNVSVPSYGQAREGVKPVRAVHYSREPRQTLDTSFYGAGIRGREAARLLGVDVDPRLKQRTYFYVDEGSGIRPEPGVGSHRHEVTLNNLYDPQSDGGAIWSQGTDTNSSELAVLNAGYDGYVVKGVFGRFGAAVVIGQHTIPVAEVESVRKGLLRALKFNLNHEPAGSSKGGQFARKPSPEQQIPLFDNLPVAGKDPSYTEDQFYEDIDLAETPEQVGNALVRIGATEVSFSGMKVWTLGKNVIEWDGKDRYATVSDASEWVYQVNVDDVYPNAEDEFNTQFWADAQSGGALYHNTQPGNVKAILEEGIGATEDSRGMSNRWEGPGVYTTTEPEWYEDGMYGDAQFEIDVGAMAKDGYTPYVKLEPDVQEGHLREAIANKLGIEDFAFQYEEDETTVVLRGNIPPKYLTLMRGMPEDDEVKKQFRERVLKFNPSHEPAGSAVGGRFARKQTSTPEFKAWFGGSKVVDAKGRPLVVYRGDRDGKTQFTGMDDKTIVPELRGNIFFTSSLSIGERYARGGKLYSVYLALKNPLIVDAGGNSWFEVPAPQEIKDEWGDPDKTVPIDNVASWARKHGYDGLIVREVIDQWGDGDQFVAFLPEQIKFVEGRTKVTKLYRALKFNPLHAPKGSPIGGQFIAKPTGALASNERLMHLLDIYDERHGFPDTQKPLSAQMKEGRQLLDDPAFRAYIQYQNQHPTPYLMKELEEGLAQGGEAAANARVELESYAISEASRLIHCWAASASDSNVMSHVLQKAAWEEFGLPDDTLQALRDQPGDQSFHMELLDTLVTMQKPYVQGGPTPWDGVKAFISAQYKNTQELLAREHITELEVSRGMSLGSDEDGTYGEIASKLGFKSYVLNIKTAMETQELHPTDVQPMEDVVIGHLAAGTTGVTSLPLSSWSVKEETAAQFAGAYRSLAVVLTTTVPARDILSLPLTGFGCRSEGEVVVLGRQPRNATYVALTNRPPDLTRDFNPNGSTTLGSLNGYEYSVNTYTPENQRHMVSVLRNDIEEGKLAEVSHQNIEKWLGVLNPTKRNAAIRTLSDLGIVL
jgi:hypothetical protein